MQDLKISEKFKSMIPPLQESEFSQLEQNIISEGIRDAICTWRGFIVDGHNRYTIAKKHGLEFLCKEMTFDSEADAVLWIVNNQLGRRNINDFVRGELVLAGKEALAQRAAQRKLQNLAQNAEGPNLAYREEFGKTRETLAAQAGISHGNINKIERVKDKAICAVADAAREGAISINQAEQLARLNAEEQERFLPKVLEGVTVEKLTKAHVANNSGNNEWYTPSEFIESARAAMGSIDCDPASSDIANKTVQAKRHYTAEINGLDQKWFGNVWMNPPYAQPLISQFADAISGKFQSREINQACVLVNNATETAWFQKILSVASAVCFPTSRIKFVDPQGNPSGAPLQGQAILYLGEETENFYKEFKKHGNVLFSREEKW